MFGGKRKREARYQAGWRDAEAQYGAWRETGVLSIDVRSRTRAYKKGYTDYCESQMFSRRAKVSGR